MSGNRMFEEMMKAARERLAGKDPRAIARNAGVAFEGGAFSFRCLERQISVSYPDYTITPDLGVWLPMLILHYLDLADGSPLTGQPITFAQQKDGMIRGGGFDRTVEEIIRQTLGKLPAEELARRCTALGGKLTVSNADLCAVFPLLPRYPLTLKIWFADEEFPASGRLLLDSSADRYLTVEDSVVAGEALFHLLETA